MSQLSVFPQSSVKASSILAFAGCLLVVVGLGCERKLGADSYAAQEASKDASKEAAKEASKEVSKATDARVTTLEKQQELRTHDAAQEAAWLAHRAKDWKAEHRNWLARGGYTGFRIPEDRYRVNFGPDHAFHVYSNPVTVVGGNPRFQYGGYWLNVVDPWPEYWAADWYDKDDVYIEYSGDGYYLYNRRYAGDRIAVNVTQN